MGFARATDERGLAFHWRISTVADRTPDEHAMVLTQLLDLEGLDLRTAVSAMAICSSAPTVTTQLRRMANRWFSDLDAHGDRPGHASRACRSSTTTRARSARTASPTPSGAYDLYPGASIVVDMGTATVFDVDQREGRVPGRGDRARAWRSRSRRSTPTPSALRSVELVRPRSVIGRSTVESIQSGVLYGFAAQVDGVVERILDELGEATVIATGGLAGSHRARTPSTSSTSSRG